MTLVLDESPVLDKEPKRRAWRRLLPVLAGMAAVVLVGAWLTAAQRIPLEGGYWEVPLDARQIGDGLTATRYVLPVNAGEQVVLTSIRNDGPLPLTVLGLDGEGGLPWMRASFRGVGGAPARIGYSTDAAAKAAVSGSSVTLAPGANADVLVAFDPPSGLSTADGSYQELQELRLSVRYLGLESTQVVPLLSEPLALIGAATRLRLEAEGRFPAAP